MSDDFEDGLCLFVIAALLLGSWWGTFYWGRCTGRTDERKEYTQAFSKEVLIAYYDGWKDCQQDDSAHRNAAFEVQHSTHTASPTDR